MASNQAVNDGALYLYRCITSSDCTINWGVVGAALDLKPGTASKRYSRLGQRIDKGNAALSARWSGDLDADGEFLLECITSCKCQIDFNAVGRTCNLRPGTASKRYARLLAKYKHSSEGSADEDAPATATVRTPASNAERTSQKKRTSVMKNESDADEESPAKRRKMKADRDRAVQVAQVKREDNHEVNIPSTDGPSDSPPEKRQTRGKKVDYTIRWISDLEEESDDSDGDDYDQVDHQSDADDYIASSDFESKPIIRRRISTGLQAGRKLVAIDGPVSKVPPNVPVGLAGMQMWQAGGLGGQAASKTYLRPTPTQITSIIPAASIDEDGYETALEMILPGRVTPSEVQTDHGVQFKAELAMASDSDQTAGKGDPEDDQIMPSIEDAQQQSRGFLARLLPWWK